VSGFSIVPIAIWVPYLSKDNWITGFVDDLGNTPQSGEVSAGKESLPFGSAFVK
jgi:hypothetical protein